MKLAHARATRSALAAIALTLAATAGAGSPSKYLHLVSPQGTDAHAKADGVVEYDYAVDWDGLKAQFPGKSLFVNITVHPLGVNSSVLGEELTPGQTASFFKVAPLLQSLADHGLTLATPMVWNISARPHHTPGDPIVEPEYTEVAYRLVIDGAHVLPKPATPSVAAPAAPPVAAPAELTVPFVTAAVGAPAHLGAHLALQGKAQSGYAVSFVIGGAEVATATTGADGDAHADWVVPAKLKGKATSIHAEVAKGPQGLPVSGQGLLVVAAPKAPVPGSPAARQ